MTHVNTRTLVRGAIRAAGRDLTAVEIARAIEYGGSDIYKLLNAMARDGEIIPRKGRGVVKVWGFPTPGEQPYTVRRKRAPSTKPRTPVAKPEPHIGTHAVRSAGGQFFEEPTPTGRIITVAPTWKPHREGRRHNVPGLLGYQSSLAALS